MTRRAEIQSDMLANDPVAATAAVRLEVRGLVSALAAALPPVESDAATWADFGDAQRVRALLSEALGIVLG